MTDSYRARLKGIYVAPNLIGATRESNQRLTDRLRAHALPTQYSCTSSVPPGSGNHFAEAYFGAILSWYLDGLFMTDCTAGL